jgi:hypothetical protein
MYKGCRARLERLQTSHRRHEVRNQQRRGRHEHGIQACNEERDAHIAIAETDRIAEGSVVQQDICQCAAKQNSATGQTRDNKAGAQPILPLPLLDSDEQQSEA